MRGMDLQKKRLKTRILAAALALALAGCGGPAVPEVENGQMSGDGSGIAGADEAVKDAGGASDSADTDGAAGKGSTDGSSAGESGGVEKNEGGYRVGSSLSGAYVDPNEQPPEKEAKAAGFTYDRDNLTYELVWSDEFDYEGEPDPEKWSYETGAGGWGNHELQNYTAGDNVTVADGLMTIELRKEEDGQYTSTRLVSRGKGDWTYCKVEASLKLPSGLGTWPAFWMMPTDSAYGGWPKSGEIDIMEHVGFDQDVIVETVHTEKYHGGQGKGKSFTMAGVSEDFHTYGVEWLPDKMIFSIDGEEKFIYDPFDYSQRPTCEIWPFDRDFFLIFNLAFGGDWGGARGTDDSYFPVEYQVDYVRVYQSPEILELTSVKGE